MNFENKKEDRVPRFYRKFVGEVYFSLKTKKLVLLGYPDESHNCDEMGCGSFDHVLAHAEITRGGLVGDAGGVDE